MIAMHIPDAYLSPQTYIPLYALFAGSMAIAVRKVKDKMSQRFVPFLGMSAAFSFLIMMFNIPIPGGTTGHAVGSALIALLFGPWVAFISVSVALIIQAFVFGDGGITAIGANCVNMALVMPFVAFYTFRIIRGRKENKGKLMIASFFAGYISLVITACVTAIELGIQPLVAHSANGTPLFAPYSIKVAFTAMALEHLLVFGLVEGLVTMVLFRYFLKAFPEMVEVLKR